MSLALVPSPTPTRRVLLPAAVSTTPPPLGARVHEFGGRTMGTSWSVRLVAGAQLPRERVLHAIQGALDAVVEQMSTWEARSDLCRFNRAAAGTWQVLPDTFLQVLT